jgi:membrane fusion protein
MEPINLPQFRDISSRWIGYITSAILIAAIAFSFVYEVELKQDARAEIVSPSDVKVQGMSGLVADVYVHNNDRVVPGTPLFRLERDLTLASYSMPPCATSRRMQLKRNIANAGLHSRCNSTMHG